MGHGTLTRWLAAAFAIAFVPFAAAQAPAKRVGVLIPFSAEMVASGRIPVRAPLEEGLRERGWIPGKNVEVLYRAHDGVEELVRIPVDVIVTFGSPELAMKATSAIPIVSNTQGNVLEAGYTKSLSRPDRNVTGISIEAHGGLAAKRLALIKEISGAKCVARLYVAEGGLRFGKASEMIPEYATAAQALRMEIFPVWVSTPEDMRGALDELARRGGCSLSVSTFRRLPGVEALWQVFLEGVERHRLPAVFDLPMAADDGGLAGYGEDIQGRARRLGYYVDRILRGAKPADLPFEQPKQLELVVNLKAARSIGLKIPDTVLLQADRLVR